MALGFRMVNASIDLVEKLLNFEAVSYSIGTYTVTKKGTYVAWAVSASHNSGYITSSLNTTGKVLKKIYTAHYLGGTTQISESPLSGFISGQIAIINADVGDTISVSGNYVGILRSIVKYKACKYVYGSAVTDSSTSRYTITANHFLWGYGDGVKDGGVSATSADGIIFVTSKSGVVATNTNGNSCSISCSGKDFGGGAVLEFELIK